MSDDGMRTKLETRPGDRIEFYRVSAVRRTRVEPDWRRNHDGEATRLDLLADAPGILWALVPIIEYTWRPGDRFDVRFTQCDQGGTRVEVRINGGFWFELPWLEVNWQGGSWGPWRGAMR